MSTVDPVASERASGALFLASTAARSMSGKSLADPETQHLRRQALDSIEMAKRLIEAMGPPLDTEPYRMHVVDAMPVPYAIPTASTFGASDGA